ncbi:MAG: hypothetical protein GY778_19680, partial [bacterium]|nr:hypothetical protein [bacterium]
APACCRITAVEAHLADGGKGRPEALWEARWLDGTETVALAVAGNAVLAVTKRPFVRRNLVPQWRIRSMDPDTGQQVWEQSLPSAARSNGLLVDRDGRVIVVLANGGLACYGTLGACIAALLDEGADPEAGRRKAIETLLDVLRQQRDPWQRKDVVGRLAELGYQVEVEGRKAGFISNWRLLGLVPWD